VVGNELSRRGMLGGMLGAGLLVAVSVEERAEAAAVPLAGPLAQPSVPLVHTRREWRARAPRSRVKVLTAKPDHIVVHHTATANTEDYSLGHAFELSRQIQRFHIGRRGWADIGEQLTISRGGHIMEGRNGSLRAIQAGRHVVGAQTLHHNEHTIGIENEGLYMKVQPPEALWSSLVEVCTWLCAVYELNPYRAIVGHRDYNSTSCPGDVLYARLPRLRREAAEALNASGPDDGAMPGGGTGDEPWSDPNLPSDVPSSQPGPPAEPGATVDDPVGDPGEMRPGEGDPQDSGPE
jgi:hypothetical protein